MKTISVKVSEFQWNRLQRDPADFFLHTERHWKAMYDIYSDHWDKVDGKWKKIIPQPLLTFEEWVRENGAKHIFCENCA